MNLTFASFCSGIGAPEKAWTPLGWRPLFFSEIEPFPCAVLAYHYPDVPNLGDMTKITDEQIKDFRPDVVVAGTPCQSFSVAGLRGGMDDPRGNLALVFLRLVDRLRPKWVVWENVPGFLSIDGGEACRNFLDAIESLGYVADIDILDAQYFDVPQRRRRIFICAQSKENILRQKTISSALTICQCVAESLQLALIVLSARSKPDSENFTFDVSEPSRSLLRRIALFDLQKVGAASMLQSNLDVLRQWCECGRGESASASGKNGTADLKNTTAIRSAESIAGTERWRDEFLSIGTSLKNALAESFSTLREFTTSTSKSETTDRKIYSCAKACLLIAAHITQSMDSSPSFWNAASSILTAVKGFIDYARYTSSSLFADMDWVQPWHDFIRQAEPAIKSLENLRVSNFDQILSVSASMSGNPAPSREAGARIAASLTHGADSGGKGGYAGRRREDDSNIVANCVDAHMGMGGPDDNAAHANHLVAQWPAEVAPTLNAHFGDKAGLEDQHIRGEVCSSPPEISLCLNAGAMGRQDFETETLIPVIGGGFSSDVTAFDTTQVSSSKNFSNPKPGEPCHPLASAAHPPAIAYRTSGNCGVMEQGDKTAALTTNTDPNSTIIAIQERAVSENVNAGPQGKGYQENIAYTLEARHHSQSIVSPMAVRRLLPVEYEKLMGQPPGYTDIKFRGKPAADGPRYRVLGNSMAVPILRWIAERIEAVESP
jgi:DNA-cytosine methyltransferase